MSKSIDPWARRRGNPVLDADGRKTLKKLPAGITYTWRRDRNRQWLLDEDGDRVAADRYQTRANSLTTPPGKLRHQLTATHATLAEAKQWLAEVRTGARDWTPPPEPEVKPETINDRLDIWLNDRGRGVRTVTLNGYKVAAKPWRAAFGETPTTELTRAAISETVDTMSGKSPTTVRLSMIVLRGALKEAVSEGVIGLDPSALVKLPAPKRRTRRAWTQDETRRFLAATEDDRNAPLFRLSLAGLRRSELLGLTWGDVAGDVIRVRRGRVAVDCRTVEVGEPKRERSRRDLPIAGTPLVAALARLKRARKSEAFALGVQVADSDYLAVDEALRPYRPERYSDLWTEAVRGVDGLPVLTLHEARHTCATQLAASGASPEVAAEWLGHDPAVYLKTYVHADQDRVATAGQMLGEAFG